MKAAENANDNVEARRLRDVIAENHLRLIGSMARKIRPTPALRFGDFVTAGYLGLLKAMTKYDPDKPQKDGKKRKSKFSAYAVSYIVGAMLKERFNHLKTVHYPNNKKPSKKVLGLIEDFILKNDVYPTQKELVRLGLENEIDINPEDAKFYLESMFDVKSLEDDIGDEEGFTLLDVMEDLGLKFEDGFIQRQEVDETEKLFSEAITNRRHLEIYEYYLDAQQNSYYGDPKMDVCRKFGIEQSRLEDILHRCQKAVSRARRYAEPAF